MYRVNQEETRFLNVDLDLYSKSSLQPLVTTMGEKVVVLHVGRHKRTYNAHLELAASGLSETADSLIRSFCALIRALPRSAVEIWNAAKVRDFNIGVQGDVHPPSFEIALAPETLRAASLLKARIVLTVYAPRLGKKQQEK
jgi:hypothetical protein